MTNLSLFHRVGNRERLVDRVVSELQQLIVDGQLQPGQKLPPQKELAELLGVSRTVIREAVHVLTTKGLLEARPGVGTIVRQVTSEQVVGPLSILLQTRGISIQDLHHVRSILEVEIAALAALCATGQDVAKLRQAIIEMESAADDPAAFAAGDADFHQALAEIAHNPLLVVLLDSIRDLMQEVRRLVHLYPGLYQIVMADHSRIMERVLARDPGGARGAMQEHLEHARSIQEQVMAQPHGSRLTASRAEGQTQ